MRKMKTHSGAKKRFKPTGKGGIKRRQKNKRHMLSKKAPKRKMRLRGCTRVVKDNMLAVMRMLRIK